MFDVFPVMWQLHELLWYLTEARSLEPASPIHEELDEALQETWRLTELDPESLLSIDMTAYRASVNVLLLRTSELVREDARRKHQGPLKQKRLPAAGPTSSGPN